MHNNIIKNKCAETEVNMCGRTLRNWHKELHLHTEKSNVQKKTKLQWAKEKQSWSINDY